MTPFNATQKVSRTLLHVCAALVFTSLPLAAQAGGEFRVIHRFDGLAYADQLGYSVAGAGDINNDGYDDIIIGAPAADPMNRQEAGSVFVISGATRTILYARHGRATGGWFGESVAGAGDVNGDGYDDFIIGVPRTWLGMTNLGEARIYSGATGGLLRRIAESGYGIGNGGFGLAVAGGGDFDGDGFADTLVGAPYSDRNSFSWNVGYGMFISGVSGPTGRPSSSLLNGGFL